MNFEQALKTANTAVAAKLGRHFSDVEIVILRGAWQSQTYEQIADASGYSISYLTRDIGPKLWKLLSQALGESVSKTNFQAALERQWRKEDEGMGRWGDISPSPHLPYALTCAATGEKPSMSACFTDVLKSWQL